VEAGVRCVQQPSDVSSFPQLRASTPSRAGVWTPGPAPGQIECVRRTDRRHEGRASIVPFSIFTRETKRRHDGRSSWTALEMGAASCHPAGRDPGMEGLCPGMDPSPMSIDPPRADGMTPGRQTLRGHCAAAAHKEWLPAVVRRMPPSPQLDSVSLPHGCQRWTGDSEQSETGRWTDAATNDRPRFSQGGVRHLELAGIHNRVLGGAGQQTGRKKKRKNYTYWLNFPLTTAQSG